MRAAQRILWCLALSLAACNSTPGKPPVDWQKLDVVGDELVAQLDIQIKLHADHPDTLERLSKLRDVTAKLDAAVSSLARGEEPEQSPKDLLQIATGLVDAWINEEQDEAILNVLSTARGLLGLLRVAIA